MKINDLEKEIFPKKVVPYDMEIVDVKVKFGSSAMYRCEAHYESFVRVWGKENSKPRFTLEEFVSYVKTAMFMEANFMNKRNVLGELRPACDTIYLPALIYIVLDNIGSCEDPQSNLLIKTSMDKTDDMLSYDEMVKISSKLMNLQNKGIELTRGIPMSKGTVEFMFLQIVEKVVTTHDPKCHPVYALIRSFIETEDNIGEFIIPRIKFASISEYDLAYEGLVEARNA